MKIILIHLVALCSVLVLAESLRYNVSSMKGSEDTYFRMKRRRPSIRPPLEEKITTKHDVCYAILGSRFFDANNFGLVDPDEKTIHDRVKEQLPQIHEHHYRSKPSYDPLNPKFANPYKMRDVSVQENVIREYMFTCLTKNCKTKDIEQYFISPEYKMDGSAELVRFVFEQNKKKEMVVIAVAEKSSAAQNLAPPKNRECSAEESSVDESSKDQENSSDNSSSW